MFCKDASHIVFTTLGRYMSGYVSFVCNVANSILVYEYSIKTVCYMNILCIFNSSL